MQEILFNYPDLQVKSGSVFDLVFDHSDASTSNQWAKIAGVKLGANAVSQGGSTLTETAGRLGRSHPLFAGCRLYGDVPLWRDPHRHVCPVPLEGGSTHATSKALNGFLLEGSTTPLQLGCPPPSIPRDSNSGVSKQGPLHGWMERQSTLRASTAKTVMQYLCRSAT